MTFYNNEQALRYVIKYAYIACMGQYMKIEELPGGHGIADVVFVPKRRSPLPALVIELKWDRGSDAALAQIEEKQYAAVLEQYGGEILCVGINIDVKSGRQTCRIGRVR